MSYLSPVTFYPWTWRKKKKTTLAFDWLISNRIMTQLENCYIIFISPQSISISLCICGKQVPGDPLPHGNLNPQVVKSLIENEIVFICTHIISRLLTTAHNLETLCKYLLSYITQRIMTRENNLCSFGKLPWWMWLHFPTQGWLNGRCGTKRGWGFFLPGKVWPPSGPKQPQWVPL